MTRSHPLAVSIAPLLFLVGLWAAVFWPVLTGGRGDGTGVVFPQGDFYNHYYNFATYQVERAQAGTLPLWNPYNGAGDPFAANIQLNTFYPPRWMTMLLWGADGWQVADHMREGVLHILITSLLMYGFVNQRTRRIGAALIGSVLWAYGGYLMSYPLQQTAVLAAATWLPLLLWGTWALFQPRALAWGVLMGSVGVGLSLLGGHPQTTLYMLYAAAAYGLYQGIMASPRERTSDSSETGQSRGRMILYALGAIGLPLGAMFALGAALSAMQMLPALEFMRLSGRLNEFTFEQKAQGFVLADLVQIIMPGTRGPMSPLYASQGGALLALIAVGRLFLSARNIFKRGRFRATPHDAEHNPPLETAFWFILWIVALGIGLGAQTPFYNLAYTLLPGIGFFRQPERTAVIAQYALVMMAVEGVRHLPAVTRRQHYLLAALVLFLTLDVLLHLRQSLPYVSDSPSNQPALSPILEQVRVPDPTHIRWRVDGAFGLRDDALRFRIPNIYHAGPLALAATEDMRQMPVDRFWEVLSVRYATLAVEQPVPDAWRLRALGEGVNSIGQTYILYELPEPRPLAYLVYDSRDAAGDRAFARQIMADERLNLRETAVTTLPLLLVLPGTRPALSTVSDVRFESPETLTLTASTDSNALLTLSIPRYPGWQAWVNGTLVETVEVYGGLIGIPLTPGVEQPIVLRFFSRPVSIGLLMNVGAVLIWLGIGIWAARRSQGQ